VGFLSAIENVSLALHIRGVSADDAVRRAEAVLVQVGLAQRQRQRAARLSAGEAQRVALARALACADGVLVVDEPTSRLDGLAGTEIAQLLRDAARRGQTVICATHDPRLIETADRVLELERLALRPEVGHPVATHNAEEPA
jgi:putative ABC transport system ATP-binding protein